MFNVWASKLIGLVHNSKSVDPLLKSSLKKTPFSMLLYVACIDNSFWACLRGALFQGQKVHARGAKILFIIF